MVNICTAYGIQWDIKFNSMNGGSHSSDFTVLLTCSTVQWVDKIKYLGCYFNQDCTIDYSMGIQKFYGNLNNNLSVLGGNRNEISTVHLVNSYCIPSLLYGCEIWSLNSSGYRKLNVIWNNAFRKLFQCCWRDSDSCLFYYCKTLPLSYNIDQRKILFIKRMRNCNNTVVRSIFTMYTCIGQITSKYSVHSLHLHTATTKQCILGHFVNASVINGNLCIY